MTEMLFTKDGQKVTDIKTGRMGVVVNTSPGSSFVMWDDPAFDAEGFAPAARMMATWGPVVMYQDSLEIEIPNLRLISRGLGRVLNPLWRLLYRFRR